MIRRAWGLIGTVSVALGVAACTSDGSGSQHVDTADAYTAAIRWYLGTADAPTPTTDNDGDSEPLIVYVAPETGKAISSGTQAAVVSELADMNDTVTVRFADVRDDVLDTEVENLPVKDDGVLLLVGAVDEAAPPVDVDIAVYRNVLDTHSFVMTIVKSGETFEATQVTEVVQG